MSLLSANILGTFTAGLAIASYTVPVGAQTLILHASRDGIEAAATATFEGAPFTLVDYVASGSGRSSTATLLIMTVENFPTNGSGTIELTNFAGSSGIVWAVTAIDKKLTVVNSGAVAGQDLNNTEVQINLPYSSDVITPLFWSNARQDRPPTSNSPRFDGIPGNSIEDGVLQSAPDYDVDFNDARVRGYFAEKTGSGAVAWEGGTSVSNGGSRWIHVNFSIAGDGTGGNGLSNKAIKLATGMLEAVEPVNLVAGDVVLTLSSSGVPTSKSFGSLAAGDRVLTLPESGMPIAEVFS